MATVTRSLRSVRKYRERKVEDSLASIAVPNDLATPAPNEAHYLVFMAHRTRDDMERNWKNWRPDSADAVSPTRLVADAIPQTFTLDILQAVEMMRSYNQNVIDLAGEATPSTWAFVGWHEPSFMDRGSIPSFRYGNFVTPFRFERLQVCAPFGWRPKHWLDVPPGELLSSQGLLGERTPSTLDSEVERVVRSNREHYIGKYSDRGRDRLDEIWTVVVAVENGTRWHHADVVFPGHGARFGTLTSSESRRFHVVTPEWLGLLTTEPQTHSFATADFERCRKLWERHDKAVERAKAQSSRQAD